jgi:hypothetical protein
MAGHASFDTNGTCSSICTRPGTPPTFTSASVSATFSQCCSSSFNVCPPGYTQGAKTFRPLIGGSPRLCGPI